MKNHINHRVMKNLTSYLTLFFLLALASCGSKSEIQVEEDALLHLPAEGVYELSNTQFESSGMELGKLEMQSFHEIVRANGMIDVPPEYRASVSSYFGGTVKDLNLLTGQSVDKGQVLFTLENPDFVQIQQDFLEAKGQIAYLKADYERQKNLAEDRVSSQKTFLKAESDYTVTKVRLESISKKLGLMGIDPSSLTIDNIRTTINIISPIKGYVTQVDIARGTYLNPSESAISIVNTDHLHLELNIFEKDLPKVKEGQTIKFRIQEDQRQEYDAEVHLVNKTVDPIERTIGIHGHLADEKMAQYFSPGMYVEAEIYSSSESKVSLPEGAVIELNGRFFTLLLNGKMENGYSFIRKEVQVGHTSSGYIEILNPEDFNDSTQFLIHGAFNLISE